MRYQIWHDRLAVAAMVGAIMLSGLSAQADDEPKPEPTQESTEIRRVEIRKAPAGAPGGEVSEEVIRTTNPEGKRLIRRIGKTAGAEGQRSEVRRINVRIAKDGELRSDREEVEETIEATDPGGRRKHLIERTIVLSDGDDQKRVLALEAAPAGDILTIRTDAADAQESVSDAEPDSKYWIGVQLQSEFPPALRSHLNLKDEEGLLVTHVFPDSPADKAGLKDNDILLGVGDQPLKGPRSLIEAVKAADGKELTLRLLRGGSERTIKVTPAERPNEGELSLDVEGQPQRDVLRTWIQRVQPGRGVRGLELVPGTEEKYEYRIVRPGEGMVLGGAIDFPEHLKINITKEGKKPARITVEQKEGKWEVTEDKLGELPADVRPHVERMLGRGGPLRLGFRSGPGGPRADVVPAPVQPPQPQQRRLRVAPPAPQQGDQGKLERRLEELEKNLDQLRQQIEKRGDDKRE